MLSGGLFDEFALALSAALAQGLTSIDNMVVLLVLIFSLGRFHACLGYLLSQVLVLGLAYGVALGAQRVLPGWTGMLGVVPLVLGLRGVRAQWRTPPEDDVPPLSPRSGTIGAMIVFVSLSFDSFAVLGPLIADSLPAYRPWALAGAGLAVLGVALTALVVSRVAGDAPRWSVRLQRLAPFIMIAAGLYVLLDTATDTL